jgi:hypothetical protein
MPLTVALMAHPTTPCPQANGIAVELAWADDGGLTLIYRLTGDPDALSLPAPAEPCRADGLWRHTCFEAFVMTEDGPGYREFNFSPSGQWAAYAFKAYRDGGTDLAMPAPAIACRQGTGQLELTARLPVAALTAGRLRIGLSAVIEGSDGQVSYWALRHPTGRPDFHHVDAFALERPWP